MKIDLFYLVCFVFIKENHADVHILSSAINSSKSLEYNNDFMYLSSCLVIIWKRHVKVKISILHRFSAS